MTQIDPIDMEKHAKYNVRNAIVRKKKILKGQAVSIIENLTKRILKTFGYKVGKFYILMQMIKTRLRYLMIKSYSDV